MSSPYFDEKGLLRNKLGITDAAELKAVEYSLTSRRMAELEAGRVTLDASGYGLTKLKAIHGHLFGDVYEWAGQVRTVPSSKRADNGMVSVFEQPDRITSSWEPLADRMTAFARSTGASLEQQREQLTSLFVDANRIHPFPEGNGRSLQVFMKHLAREQAIELDFSRTNAREWNLASAVSGTHGRLFERTHLIPSPPDTNPVRKIFDQIARPARAVAFEKLAEADACAQFPELRGAYAGLRAIEDRARASFGNDAERVAGYVHQVRDAFIKRLDEGKPLQRLHQVTPGPEKPQDRERGR